MDETEKLVLGSVVGVLLTGVLSVGGSWLSIGSHVVAALFAVVVPMLAFARREWLALGAVLLISVFAGLAWTLGLPGGATGHLVTGILWCGATAWLALE